MHLIAIECLQSSTHADTNIGSDRALQDNLYVISESNFYRVLSHFNILSYNALTITMATSLAVTPGEVRSCNVK